MNKSIWIAVMCAATVLHAHQPKAQSYQYTVVYNCDKIYAQCL